MVRSFKDANIEVYLQYRDQIPTLGVGRPMGRLITEETGRRNPKGWAKTIKSLKEYEDELSAKLAAGKKLDAGEQKHARMLGLASGHQSSQTPAPLNPGPGDQDESAWIDESEYWYDKDNDCYYTYLRGAGQNVRVPGNDHRAMKEAYSNMVGKGSTINQIARDFNFPRHWFDEYRRKHGWTHDMDPFTDEEMLAVEDPDELVNDLILRRRRQLHKKYESKRWDEIRRDAESWINFEETVMKEIKDALSTSWKPIRVPKIKMNKEVQSEYALVISPTDFHWGKGGWVDEVGEHFDFDEARERLFQKTEELINRLPYSPEKIYLATGSDWFHVDNHQGTTTRGTPQDMSGSPAQILMTGCELAREHIDLLRQVAPVEVMFMRGNHDKHSSLTLMLYLAAVYENAKDVDVNIDPKVRQYASYGNTLIGFTHGDGVQHGSLPGIMAAEVPEMWGDAYFRVWFTGHRHHQHLKEERGCTVYTLPSLAGKDRWHYQAGYISQPGLAAHMIDSELGVVCSWFAPVVK